jgi:hypothetical protein
MTAGLIKVLPSEIVLVADTLCVDGATGSAIAGAQKLFIHGGKAAIFSWGRGPGDVQEKVRGLDPSEVRPAALARALRETFRAVSSPYLFGLFIAGFDGAKPSLWHVDVPVSDAGTQDRSSSNDPWTVSPPGAGGLHTWAVANRLMEPLALGVQFVQMAHALAPGVVSADAEIVRVTAGGAQRVPRPT